jgi:hypothetical protein
MEAKMKRLIFLMLLFAQSAWPQIKSGTIVVYYPFHDELTVAADSRQVSDHEHDDTSCKIATFGPQFVFAVSGTAGRGSDAGAKWNAYSIARNVWERESKIESPNPFDLITRVADGWIAAMEPLYGDPFVVQDARKQNSSLIASALLATTNKSGLLAIQLVNIRFDLNLFDSTGKVRITHDSQPADPNIPGGIGFGKIALEFGDQTTPRAKEYMKWFATRTSNMTRSDKLAELTSKLVELSILLQPDDANLAFPIDVLQLKGGSSVKWRWVKPNCE